MTSKTCFILVFLLAATGADRTQAADAAETVWSGLVLATCAEHPKEPPSELAKFYGRLKNIFGYNQFELIGQHQEAMDYAVERWLVPGDDFSLLVHSRKSAKAGCGYRLKLQLYHEKRMLATMDARLDEQNLLFIRGPLCGKGQMIIVLTIKN